MFPMQEPCSILQFPLMSIGVGPCPNAIGSAANNKMTLAAKGLIATFMDFLFTPRRPSLP